MTHTLHPHDRPFVWSLRCNWDTPNGLFYDPQTGEMFSVTKDTYVQYLGRLPKVYLKQQQLELL
jgi:hypothetical protein